MLMTSLTCPRETFHETPTITNRTPLMIVIIAAVVVVVLLAKMAWDSLWKVPALANDVRCPCLSPVLCAATLQTRGPHLPLVRCLVAHTLFRCLLQCLHLFGSTHCSMHSGVVRVSCGCVRV